MTVWGEEWPAELGRRVDPVQQGISSAARAFKFHALIAAAVPTTAVNGTEALFRIGTESFGPLYAV